MKVRRSYMKRDGILHPELLEILAAAGHGDQIVLADAGLRIPSGTRCVDLALTCGIPGIVDVVKAIERELVIEAAMVATEFEEWNPVVYGKTLAELSVEPDARPHRELMDDMAQNAYAFVKTGECSAYASVVLVCGVSYLDDALELYKELHGTAPA